MVFMIIIRFCVFPTIIAFLQFVWFMNYFFVKTLDFIFPGKQPRVVRTPEERFDDLEAVGYTFRPNYVELPIGAGKKLPRLHYVDEGPRDGRETILCLHGEPSWSFLYRHMIHMFAKAGYRVIAPDFIGFGKSDKYTQPDSYTHDMHTMTLRLLLDYLNLRRITLVCQDWGGPIGLTVVKDSPHLFSRIVVMNTGLPVAYEPATIANDFMYITPFLLWRSIAQVFGTYLPIRQLFKFALKGSVPSEVLNGYCAPFPTSVYKAGAKAWPLLIPVISNTPFSSEMYETREFLAKAWTKEALILFADGDKITAGWKKTFLKVLPNAVNKTVVGAGHFLQEDKGKEVANHIISFIEEKM
ncbi:hypothetical protein SK128_006515 [Halocaridina rubra]|uniref:AB hydrolase-1 domain-containing protein n=1 Tax=Halocaridina rubra TaxID=373956 RepID=A0AAN8ZTS5_HALRR